MDTVARVVRRKARREVVNVLLKKMENKGVPLPVTLSDLIESALKKICLDDERVQTAQNQMKEQDQGFI